jgi:hypothetical protein
MGVVRKPEKDMVLRGAGRLASGVVPVRGWGDAGRFVGCFAVVVLVGLVRGGVFVLGVLDGEAKTKNNTSTPIPPRRATRIRVSLLLAGAASGSSSLSSSCQLVSSFQLLKSIPRDASSGSETSWEAGLGMACVAAPCGVCREAAAAALEVALATGGVATGVMSTSISREKGAPSAPVSKGSSVPVSNGASGSSVGAVPVLTTLTEVGG